MPSSKETITSKPVRGSWPFGVPEAASPVVGAVPDEVELAVGTFELVDGLLEPLLLPPPPPEPELPELLEPPPVVLVMWPFVLPPPEFASGSWYWSSPALWARLVAGSASMASAATRAAVRLRSIGYL